MAFLMIGLSFALVVGSLMWMLPSPKEKLLAKLRDNAIQAGFHPKFITMNDYLKTLPKTHRTSQGFMVRKHSKPSNRQLLRYVWHGDSPSKEQRELKVLFSPQNTVVALIVNDVTLKEAEWQRFQAMIDTALDLGVYLEGLLAIECKDNKGKRLISLFWSEQGEIDKIDFKSQQIQALQKCF